MASIRCRKDTGLLLIDFRFRGTRCREQTMLPDTAANRARLQTLADRIERSINKGTFRYAEFFPNSPRAKLDGNEAADQDTPSSRDGSKANGASLPLFSEFAEVWFSESEPKWRKRYRASVRDVLDKVLLPFFGSKRLDAIVRADALAFRSQIAKRAGRAGRSLSAKRINKLMMHLNAILNEGCDRYGIGSPARGIKPLKQKRAEVQPFSLDEVERLTATIRDDYRPYLTVRCFTGLRTGEANGLQWSDIDFTRNTITVNRSVSRDGDGDLKTDFSHREIPMPPQVRTAIEEQRTRAVEGCPWVFHTLHANPIDAVNFTNRVWYPLLRHLGLAKRPPYQMRHTAATLMLASGENPEWVAKVLGHANTDMLFRVYSRFVPNLTRQDGLAFAGLITSHSGRASRRDATAENIEAMDVEALRQALKAALFQHGRVPVLAGRQKAGEGEDASQGRVN
jgi:integrase